MIRVVAFVVLLLTSLPAGAAGDVVTERLTDNVHSVYSGFYTSLVVVGDEGVLITDPANAYRAATLEAEIAKITELPVTHIVLSHEHYDHVGGTEVFEGAQIIVQEKAVPVFGLDAMGYAPKTVDQTFDQSLTIMMGETKVEVVHFGFPSDGVANSVVYLPEEGVLYSSDLYEVKGLQDRAFIEALNSAGVREALNRLLALNPKYAIASHSIGHDPEALRRAAAFFNDLHDAVVSRLKEASAGGYEAIATATKALPQELKLEAYEDMENYEDLDRHIERMIESVQHGG